MKKIKKILFEKQISNFKNNNLSKFLSQKLFLEIPKYDSNFFPKISVIMPSFNQVEFIEKSILSILNQDYPNLELIIIDGGSKDGSLEIIERYDKYIYYWVSEKDNGQSNALNKGISKATGEILGWMNSDDIYLPNAFNLVAETYIKFNKPSVIFGNHFSIDGNDQILDVSYSFPFSQGQLINEGFVAVTQSFFWTKELNSKIKGFDENLYTNMDYDFYLQLGLNHDIKKWKYINYFLGCFRRQENQKTSNKYRDIIRKDLSYIKIKFGISDTNKFSQLFYKLRRYYYYFVLSQ